ncbi:MAG: hypothetical protein FWJ73_09140 [Limnochordales bacterium]|jgi:hypothetical protein|nr:hypothetical protein [Bacillota bacterium]
MFSAFPGKEDMFKFSSFSGTDMVCTIGEVVFGELQQIAFSIEREIAPIYTMGSPNLRAYSRGKRGITGTLIFQMFDRDSLLQALMMAMKKEGVDIHTAAANLLLSGNASNIFDWNVAMQNRLAQALEDGQLDVDELFLGIMKEHALRYLDQVPPFDITITGKNELGLTTSLRILGVQIMTEASGISVDDITLEKAVSFIAREVIPWGYDKIQAAVQSGVYQGVEKPNADPARYAVRGAIGAGI